MFKARQVFNRIGSQLESRRANGETLTETEEGALQAVEDLVVLLNDLECQAGPTTCSIRRVNAGQKMMRAWAILEAEAAGSPGFDSVAEFTAAWLEALREHNPTTINENLPEGEGARPLALEYVWGSALAEPKISTPARLLRRSSGNQQSRNSGNNRNNNSRNNNNRNGNNGNDDNANRGACGTCSGGNCRRQCVDRTPLTREWSTRFSAAGNVLAASNQLNAARQVRAQALAATDEAEIARLAGEEAEFLATAGNLIQFLRSTPLVDKTVYGDGTELQVKKKFLYKVTEQSELECELELSTRGRNHPSCRRVREQLAQGQLDAYACLNGRRQRCLKRTCDYKKITTLQGCGQGASQTPANCVSDHEFSGNLATYCNVLAQYYLLGQGHQTEVTADQVGRCF